MRNANKLHRHLSTTPVSLASAIIISLLIFAPITPCLAEAKKDQGRDKPSSTNYVPLAKVSLSVVVTNHSLVGIDGIIKELDIAHSNLMRAEKRLIEARKDADYLLP
ncbi:MAG TPA: hypothetical protein PJ991_12720, partial [Kiritimatiellia bacterium]|nr:hypothetical protein [Kiritimatiellia bacterium]